ncbi:polysaccharide deacetylase family protein [Micromonospora sp. NPDC049559]|uniref:polysaccharide deacetylase family protein n=1 Tax=Micromonospora sp. NPDC049559 TaxID=3155923 RepID=UPI0034186EB4
MPRHAAIAARLTVPGHAAFAARLAALVLLLGIWPLGDLPAEETTSWRSRTIDAAAGSPSPAPGSPDGPGAGQEGAPKGGGAKPGKPPAPRPKIGPHGTRRLTGVSAVALTFDDGPHPTWTPKILEQLRTQQVKATFCLVGTRVRKNPELVAQIVREGHTLCNHSWAHDLRLGKKPEAQIRADLDQTNREIRRAVPGVRIPFYRQPGGEWTPSVVHVAKALGMVPLHWDVDPRDWDKPGAPLITKRISTTTRSGSIVLLHDGGGDRSATLAACPAVIGELKRRYGVTLLK